MPEIKPSLTQQDIICAEVTGEANAMVIFGASGDLTQRKLLPSLFALFKRGLIKPQFYILGCGRKELSDRQFRQIAQQAIGVSAKESGPFINNIYYTSGDYSDGLLYSGIKARLLELDKRHGIEEGGIFYLAVPPFLYTTIVEQLRAGGLSCPGEPELKKRAKLVVEKPFGRDLQNALELSKVMRECFDESQIYRIDHYLGKETVQNILMFRFANSIFEPIWNRNYVDHVQITIAESIGIEHRGGYYDKSGALRDMFQNHMLGILAFVAMEPPVSFEADSIRDEKVKLLRSIRPFKLERLEEFFIRGQYGPGLVNGRKVAGYRAEPEVEAGSKTETFVAAKLFIDNLRWKDVPFYLRTGKMLAAKDTEVAITFKKVPHSMFVSAGLEDMPPNVLVLQIQPEEGIVLSFQAKRPGSKVCMSTLRMSFSYHEIFGGEAPEAYQRLLLDCMVGDQTLFTRADDIEAAWRLLTPVLRAWEKSDSPPYEYPAGSETFSQADELIERDGRKWRKLSQP